MSNGLRLHLLISLKMFFVADKDQWMLAQRMARRREGIHH